MPAYSAIIHDLHSWDNSQKSYDDTDYPYTRRYRASSLLRCEGSQRTPTLASAMLPIRKYRLDNKREPYGLIGASDRKYPMFAANQYFRCCGRLFSLFTLQSGVTRRY